MSIKDLFNSTSKTVVYSDYKDEKQAFESVESKDNAAEIIEEQKTFIPAIDYSTPTNFAKFGSARLYYQAALDKITNYYPYDGSNAEKNKFYNSLLEVEKYVFDNLYPRTNGYAIFSADGWGTQTTFVNGIGVSDTAENITFFAGPGTGSVNSTSLVSLSPNPMSSKFNYANVYDENIYQTAGLPDDYGKGTRTSNLRMNFVDGVTTEFWLKTGSLNTASTTEAQLIFDAWNGELSSSADHARMLLYVTSSTTDPGPFNLTISSGSAIVNIPLGNNIPNGLSDWKHYAITVKSDGSSYTDYTMYVNGLFHYHTRSATFLSELNTKNMVGRLGALQTSPPGAPFHGTSLAGGGKLSGSMDEFRFWKVARSQKQIAENYFDNVGGGNNTDISNTTLGVYYKFNEGITGDTSTDSYVLDYAGRVANGTWTGYTSNSRNTGSAIIESSAAIKEYKEPIIRTNHPSYISLETQLQEDGTFYDSNNNAAFLNYAPSWVIEEHEKGTNNNLSNIAHLMGAYFDKIHNLITEVPKLKQMRYQGSSESVAPFNMHLPQSLGLYAPDMFVDATILENLRNRNKEEFFEENLNDTKNLIYQNLYNNLTDIYKSKGTEKAIRNVFRCFNLDDSIIRLKTYSNNEVYQLSNNLRQLAIDDKRLNLNSAANFGGVVYQRKTSSDSDVSGFISGTAGTPSQGIGDSFGFTAEAEATFPKFFNNYDQVSRNFTEVSLFGMHTVDMTDSNSKDGTDTTIPANDYANFQVYAIRDAEFSPNVKFKLSSSSPFLLPELTSSVFLDTYDDNRWNFSVRLRTENPSISGLVSGSASEPFKIIFRGVNTTLGAINNSFELTASVPASDGLNIMQAAKRIYCGARRENITGSLTTKSDVYISNVKYWTKFIDNDSLDLHVQDFANSGVKNRYQNISSLDPDSQQQDILNWNTLALEWNFDNVTGSDSGGNFNVQDYSSGSIENINSYGWLGSISGYKHTGYAENFETSSTNVTNKALQNTFRIIDPEENVSSNMIQLLSEDDTLYRLVETVPNYVFSIEKSMYQAISEEMLSFLAGVNDFNNIVGDPTNRYRERYKDMENLREVFFRRVSNINDVEKFFGYYKWFDEAISNILTQLVPASADYNPEILNVVESHVLERNKYASKFPTTEFEDTVPDSFVQGFGARSYPGFLGQSTVPSSPRDTTTHLPFWKKRAIRSASEITSGDATIDSQRDNIKEVINLTPTLSQSQITVSTIDGQRYQYKPYFSRAGSSLYRLTFDSPITKSPKQSTTIKGGVNFPPTKNIDYTYTALRPAGPVATGGGVFVPQNILLAFAEDFVNIPIDNDPKQDPTEKTKRVIKVQHGRDWEGGIGYKNTKSTKSFPFNIVSSSLNTGYQKEVQDNISDNINIVNLHNDVYGPHMEKPIQGPFTEHNVGGHQSRHVEFNREGTDTWYNRPEAWYLFVGSSSTSSGAIGMTGPDYPWPEANTYGMPPYPATGSQKAWMYRDFTAKSPVNIKNIRRSGSNVLGNYRESYEIINTFGKFSNPSHLIEETPSLPPGTFQGLATSSMVVSTFLDINRTPYMTGTNEPHFQFTGEYSTSYLTGVANKSIISNRFGAPGGIETSTHAYKDWRSSEFSVYNVLPFKNLSVKRESQVITGSELATTGRRLFDIHGNDYGLRSHLARPTGKFGRDSFLVANPGESYQQAPGFHKVHRNEAETVTNPSEKDNFFVTHQIPRKTKNYAWVTGSVSNYNPDYTPLFTPQNFLVKSGSTLIEAYDFVSSSEAGVDGGRYGVVFVPGAPNFIPVDFAGMNTVVRDHVSSSTNTLGLDGGLQCLNPEFVTEYSPPVGPGEGVLLNGILSNRGGVYGWSGWQSLRSNNHKILRKERESNKLSLKNPNFTITRYDNPPISTDGRPVLVNFDYGAPEITNLTIELPYGEKQYFNTNALNNRFNFNQFSYTTPFEQTMQLMRGPNYKLNWVVYRECIFPADRNEFLTYSRERTGYDNRYWRDSRTDRQTLGALLTTSFGYENVCQSSWPLDAPVNFITRTHPVFFATASWTASYDASGPTGENGFYNLINSGCAGELQNTYSTFFDATGSAQSASLLSPDDRVMATLAGPIYARKTSLSSLLASVRPSGIANSYATQQDPQKSAWVTGSTGGSDPQYRVLDPMKANKHSYTSAKNDRFAGEAEWQAGQLAGIITVSNTGSVFVSQSSEPWFDQYSDFKYELQKMAKDYAIVPEFRVSENLKSYSKNGIFGSKKTDTFEIVGTDINSSQDSFYKDYSNSDFLKEFLNVKSNTLLGASEIKLVCNAAVRFNPYEGFYPAQRTLQMVEQFKESYANCYSAIAMDSVQNLPSPVTFTSGSGLEIFEKYPGATKPLNQVMFAPGILYNSIKSGISVDYPIITDGTKILRSNPYLGEEDYYLNNNSINLPSLGQQGNQNNSMIYCGITSSNTPGTNPWYSGSDGTIYKDFFDNRIPFEAIVDPKKHLTNVSVYDLESDAMCHVAHVTTFEDSPTDNNYKLMAQNFFGSVSEFFLADDDFTSLKSSTFTGTRKFESGSVYMARVKLYSSFSGSRDYSNEYVGSVGKYASEYSVWLRNGARAITGSFSGGVYSNVEFLSGNQWFPVPQHPRNADGLTPAGKKSKFQQDFTLYSRTDAFGPPLAGTFAPDTNQAGQGIQNSLNLWYTSSFAYAGWGMFGNSDLTGYTSNTYSVSPWDTDLGNSYPDMTPLPVFDSLNGYNWAYTPPYYDGEAWADLIFRPDPTKDYDLKTILAETQTNYWRVDPGYTNPDTAENPLLTTEFVYNVTGNIYNPGSGDKVFSYPSSPYTGKMINSSSMQVNASINLFGVEDVQFTEEGQQGSKTKRNESVGQRWVIKPKFETPHMNFSDIGARPLKRGYPGAPDSGNVTMPENNRGGAIPGFGQSSVPQGMWHQFGILEPDPNKGIFLQIGDIEQEWLKYHYNAVLEPSVYNNFDQNNGPDLHKNVKSLAELAGFNKETTKKRLGQLKDSLTVKEAVVAVPYIITSPNDVAKVGQTEQSRKYYEGKRFIEIPRERFQAASEELKNSIVGSSLDAAGISIREQIQKMNNYVMPPQFDFVNNSKINPVAMYIFEFSYTFDKDDLSYIWQNLAPRNYKQVFMQSDSVAHKLINTEILSEKNLEENENLRWMVFKVKQKSQADYYDHVETQADQASNQQFLKAKKTYEEEYLQYNWPYDYLSFVELIKIDTELKFGDRETTTIGGGTKEISTTPEVAVSNIPSGVPGMAGIPSTQITGPTLDTSQLVQAPEATLQTAVPTVVQQVQSVSDTSGIVGAQRSAPVPQSTPKSTTKKSMTKKRKSRRGGSGGRNY